jgi:hypothetical protein
MDRMELERAVDGEVAMVDIHMRPVTTRCHPFQHSKARWEHIRPDTNSMMINGIEGI